jgi:3'-5' exoribonuclease
MKSPYIKDLQPNQTVVGTFLVRAKEVRQKKTGEPYLSLLLSDKTGEVDAKMWDNVADVMDTFSRDDFVKVKGLYNIYQNRPQLTIHKMQRADEAEIDPADYFAASERDPDQMLAELRDIAGGVANPHLKSLLDAVMGDENITAQLRRAPAAKMIHHAYLGGLLEHVLSLCRLCLFAASHYKDIDRDLLITGAILHDIGKIYELSYERSPAYTTEGQLLGHIVIGVRMVEDKLRNLPNFPEKLRTLVEHMILSHHGHLEFGSPKVPLFPEAMLLFYLDDLDSKMACMSSLLHNDRQVEGDWTGYSSSLERTLLKKLRYLERAEAPDSPDNGLKTQSASLKEAAYRQATLFGEKLRGALDRENS